MFGIATAALILVLTVWLVSVVSAVLRTGHRVSAVPCPHCRGAGVVPSPQIVTDRGEATQS